MGSPAEWLKFLLSPPVKVWLKEQLKSYETRFSELNDVVEKLKKLQDIVKNKTDEEEYRHGREILVEVKKWIEKVEQLVFEYEDFKEDETWHELAVFDLKSGYLPKPGIRYRQRRIVDGITRNAKELLQTAKFDSFSYWSGPPSIAPFFSNVGYESFPSREETMRKIIEELEKPSVRMIGLHGLSGVGKTTLVKQVAKKALEDKMFDVVPMASVTKNPDIRKIQGQIIDMLGVILDEESDIARAARIQKILKNEKKSTLIILDDLWEKLDFNMLGIPYEIDNEDGLKNVKGKSLNVDGLKNVEVGISLGADGLKNVKEEKYPFDHGVKAQKTISRYKGCKILMISESKQVLLSQMEGKANPIFPMQVLTEKEAEVLFNKMAGVGDKNSEFEKLAAQIANKCNGLPMSIVTTARALKNQSRSVWEDIHRKLEWQNSTGAPEFSTKLSYDLLEDEELKSTFLLCACMGHDALIMDLVKYCIGLGFLRGIYTARETRDRVYALVVKLKDSGLLSDSYSSDQFTMQDTVRSAALSIAYMENHFFTMAKGKIDDWPDKLERYAAISLHHCDFIEGFLKKRNYPRLRVFQVNNNDPKLEIPSNFFKGMKELKVLILTGIRLSLLKLSISSLTELRMLCLEQCVLDKNLSIIGKLKKLRILSFSGSDIENLPVELEQLKKLQIFDISNCSRLKEIPFGVISSLVSLEELYMRNTMIEWEAEEHTDQSDKASLSELKHLNQLTTLDIQIPNVSLLPKNLFFDKLHSYNIIVGDFTAYSENDFKMPEKYETLKFLAIRLKDGFDIHSLRGIKMLFESVENLFLEELNVVQDIFYRLNLKGFPHLKHLWIVNNSTIQSLIHPKDREHPEKAFPKLESLCLYNLKNMDKICSCELSEPSFGKLKVIKINLCGQMKNVFSLSVVRLLTLLETIEVSECDSLKNIVPVERQSNTNKIELLKFPELLFLKLQSLSEFIGLYPIEEKRELFHEKVEVSKLDRMELSSIPIDIIWSKMSDQPSPRSSFQNLRQLDVNGCWELKYLISFTMAKSLVSLQSLFVSECEKMTSIFPLEQHSHQKMKGSIFPKLKNVKLRSMKSLSEIWNLKLPSDSFRKLDTLIIEECVKLVNVFPCYTEGMFSSLCNLRVTNCRSMQAIFDQDDKRDFGREYLSNLQDVHLEALPKLEHVWKLSKDRGGILNMNNLQKIRVQDCDGLKNIFPFSVASKCLHNLEYLVVCNCFELREIVAKGEAANTGSDNFDPLFDFPKLSTIRFSALPRFTSFYPGAYELFCPKLNDLSVERCHMLEPFSKQPTNAQRKLALFPEKVINKLKSMQIESRHAKSRNSCMGEGNHRKDNLEELCLSRLLDTEILYSFLHRNPNLISLSLNNCSFEEIAPRREDTEIENFGVVPKLKSLKLIDLPELKEIRFEPDIILERIEFLILQNCPCLITVVPSSVSLTHLTNLEVVNCKGLKNLMSASTAKSLGQLNTMKVIKCESLMEIVGKEGENAGTVVFKQLKALELVSLENLKSFCSSDCCHFEFPSLENLVVSACSNMEKFSEKVTSTPILQNINVVHEKEKKRCCWEGDLNATIQKIFKEKKFLEGMAMMSFSKHPELRRAWQDEVGLQNNWFYSLKILKLENCEIQPCAIPSYILPYLKTLKELEVRDCDNVEVIFDMNITEDAETTFQLQKLTLERLPKLMHVWKRNGKGTHSFRHLQVVFASDCDNLQTVFPLAVAKNLKKLDKLEIEYCFGLLQIVGKEEDAAADVTQKFVFPCLTTLSLYVLPDLIYFYPESFTLECPVLDNLFVWRCQKLELESANRNSLFSGLKDISNVQNLSLNWEHISVLRSNLGELAGCYGLFLVFDDDENENHILSIGILKMAPNLKHISICCCHCLEVFSTRIPEIDENRMLIHLKTMTLYKVSKLQSIGSEDSPWLNVICDKLHQFSVSNCRDLTTLVHSPSAVSFTHLKELYISECHGLKYLFTSSSANKLIHLKHIQVRQCDSIKEIVAEEQDGRTSGEIKLERLYLIDLIILPSLECFYSGNHALQLPSLMQVNISNCPKMEIFFQGSMSAVSFRGIQASSDLHDELFLSNDANSSVKDVFLHQEFFKAVGEDYFSKTLFGKVGLQNKWLCNLVTLNLGNCTLQFAIPSNILPYLNKLVELKVRDSDKVEVIFDMKVTEKLETASQLKKLTLEGLSKLTRLWEKNSQGDLHFCNLHEVVVSGCENLQILLPASLAKNIEKVEIQSCHKLQGVVEKEEGTAANVTEKFVFPHLEKLCLCDLPQLTYFYPQTFTLEYPALNELSVSDCHELELFQNAHPISEDEGTSIYRQPLISNPKVISNLKKLRLDWKNLLALGLRFRSKQFVEGLNYLQKISLYFHADEDEKAMLLPIEILQKAPNLIEMSIEYCNSPELFVAQCPKIGEDGILGQLKILTLSQVSILQSVELEDSSWLNTIYEKLHELNVDQCSHLTTLVHSISAVSFSCLKKVSISNCPNLQYLFTPSAAKKLMHLEEITVKECKSVEKIMAKETDVTSEAIKFERLNTIVLHSLPTLICFYSGNDTLHLSSLISVQVRECPNMKIFSQGVIDAESFRGIQMSSDPKEDLHFRQDLNATTGSMFQRQVFLKAVDKECFPDKLEQQADWHGKVGLQNKWLSNLVTLKLNNCALQYAIPSAILPHLNNLKELEVRDSEKVEAIFDMNDIEILEKTSQLKKLTLKRLSQVKRVWEKNSQGVLFFQNLKHIFVSNCENLQTLFPASLAKNLKKLEKLEIQHCDSLPEIVEKEESTAANVTEKFVFPCLENLYLQDLPQLTYFYPQTFNLECPALNELTVLDCPNLELFQSAHPTNEGEGTSIHRQPLISNLKVISKLKELKLDWKHIWILSLRLRSEEFAEGLNYLENILLFFDADENEKAMLPIEILQKAPNLTKMGIRYCNSPEIFLAQNPKTGEDEILGQLKILTLGKVSALQSMEPVNSSWLNTIREKLHELYVEQCSHLTTLAHTVSFSCLKKVSITNCLKLQYLFTSSAAKKLIHLEHMEVQDCKSIKEVVAKEQDETTSGEIKLERLYRIHLNNLTSLECFYSGNDTLQLPSLTQVNISKCPKMEIFSQGLIHVNSSVEKVFLRQDHLVFGHSHMLQEIWKLDTLPNWYFRNLTSMIVEGCDFISNAILPSHLLPFLSNLKKLLVRKCNSLKAIFSHTNITNMGPQGSLSLPFLKKLHVENCEGLVAIVEKDAAKTEEANNELTISSSITLLRLLNLPNLRCIYPGMHILEWGMLRELHVKHCQNLKFFATNFPNSQDLHPDGQDRLSTNQQAIISLNKVTPRMKVMSLGMEEAKMIEHGELCIDLPKLNSMKLQCFSDEFPFVFGLNVSLSIPSIEKLGLLHSDFKEIFPSQTPGIDFTKILSQLKELELQSLFQLESIGLGHSWITPFLEKLETLLVRGCHCLTNLTPCAVSFSNLVKFTVKDCRGLKYVFTFSTAKTLVVLKEMHIIKCKSLKTIVAKDGEEEGDVDEDNIVEEEGEGDEDDDEDEDEEEDEDEDGGEDEDEAQGDEDETRAEAGSDDTKAKGNEYEAKTQAEVDEAECEVKDENEGEGECKDELIFNKLETLTLRSLPKLRSFYTGSSTLNFPSLKVLRFRKCYLKPFRLHDKFATKKLKVITDEFGTRRNINSVIMKQDEEEASFLS